jgi:cytochrome c-type biogenesis protein CcmF
VIYPLISELFTGGKVTVGPPFYERATAPLFASLMFLMAVAPLSAWGTSSLKKLGNLIWKPTVAALIITIVLYFTYTQKILALIGFFLITLVILVTLYEYARGGYARQRSQNENYFAALWNLTGRDRRRYGGYIIHISMMLMAIGILGIESFQTSTQGRIGVGQSLNLANYTISYKELASWDDQPKGVNYTRAVVDVYRNGIYLGQLHPRKDYYFDSQQTMTIPGERATLKDDLYVLLIDWEPASTTGATFKVFVNPLVNWLWLGAFVFLAGVIIAAWPEKEMERVPITVRSKSNAQQPSAAD